jgi:hypothetical protein
MNFEPQRLKKATETPIQTKLHDKQNVGSLSIMQHFLTSAARRSQTYFPAFHHHLQANGALASMQRPPVQQAQPSYANSMSLPAAPQVPLQNRQQPHFDQSVITNSLASPPPTNHSNVFRLSRQYEQMAGLDPAATKLEPKNSTLATNQPIQPNLNASDIALTPPPTNLFQQLAHEIIQVKQRLLGSFSKPKPRNLNTPNHQTFLESVVSIAKKIDDKLVPQTKVYHQQKSNTQICAPTSLLNAAECTYKNIVIEAKKMLDDFELRKNDLCLSMDGGNIAQREGILFEFQKKIITFSKKYDGYTKNGREINLTYAHMADLINELAINKKDDSLSCIEDNLDDIMQAFKKFLSQQLASEKTRFNAYDLMHGVNKQIQTSGYDADDDISRYNQELEVNIPGQPLPESIMNILHATSTCQISNNTPARLSFNHLNIGLASHSRSHLNQISRQIISEPINDTTTAQASDINKTEDLKEKINIDRLKKNIWIGMMRTYQADFFDHICPEDLFDPEKCVFYKNIQNMLKDIPIQDLQVYQSFYLSENLTINDVRQEIAKDAVDAFYRFIKGGITVNESNAHYTTIVFDRQIGEFKKIDSSIGSQQITKTANVIDWLEKVDQHSGANYQLSIIDDRHGMSSIQKIMDDDSAHILKT